MTSALSLEAIGVCHWRGQRPLQVLRDVSLRLEAGELAGVWAKAGGGKTTLLEVAAGVLVPERGRVVIGSRDLSGRSPREISALLHDCVGLATRQGPAVPDLPVGAWIELRLMSRVGRRVARARVQQILERVGVGEVVGEPWRNLSDSERILVAIARAVVCEPKVLLVDDPAAGLDMMERLALVDLLRSVARTGVGVLISASDMADLQGVDSVWSLADGYLLGPPRQTAAILDFAPRSKEA